MANNGALQRELNDARAEMSRTDNALLELLSVRHKIAQRIAQIKQASGQPIYDPERERAELTRMQEFARTLEPVLRDLYISQVMALVFAESREVQAEFQA